MNTYEIKKGDLLKLIFVKYGHSPEQYFIESLNYKKILIKENDICLSLQFKTCCFNFESYIKILHLPSLNEINVLTRYLKLEKY